MRQPVFHQLAFGGLVASTTFRLAWLLRNKLKHSPAAKARNSETRRLQIWGSISFVRLIAHRVTK